MSGYKYEFGKVFEFEPVEGSKHEASVIMLHGLGDTGEGWSFCGKHMQMPGVRWLFPTAPTRPISCNMGMAMPGWFDIKNLPLDTSAMDDVDQVSQEQVKKHMDDDDVADSVNFVLSLVKKEMDKGIPSEKIVLGGFSQGGLVAARAALESTANLAGCVVLSSWVGHFNAVDGKGTALPFFIGHGEADPMVPVALGHKSNAFLKNLEYNVTLRTYRGIGCVESLYINPYPCARVRACACACVMDPNRADTSLSLSLCVSLVVVLLEPCDALASHSASPEELDDVKDFLGSCLAPALSLEEASALSAGKIKKLLLSKGVDITGCLEKADLLEKLKTLY